LKYHNDELIPEMVDMFEKVLFPTDFSKYSQKVLECVKELPGVNEVVLLHVIGPADPLARVWNPGGRIDESKANLTEQSKILSSRGFSVKTRTEAIMEGDISRVIQKVADEEKSSVIVMGARQGCGGGYISGKRRQERSSLWEHKYSSYALQDPGRQERPKLRAILLASLFKNTLSHRLIEAGRRCDCFHQED
jgi:nucleotide-binding universal stress UspA family protein